MGQTGDKSLLWNESAVGTLLRHRRKLMHVGVVLAAVGAQAFVLVSPAEAATAVTSSNATITITAAPGRFNNITINQVGTNFTITDTGDAQFSFSLPCFLSGAGVACPVAGINRVVVNAGDLQDRITKNANVRGELNGGDGNDVIIGGPTPGSNVLTGGNGDDTITGGTGADSLTGGPGKDTITGGGGVDLVSYTDYTGGGTVLVQLDGIANDGPPGESDNIGADVENLFGSPGNDIMSGSAANNVLSGFGGNDLLVGGGGNDTLSGGPGEDSLYGAEGNDTIDAKDGVSGNDIVNGGPGTDRCTAESGDLVNLCE